MTIAAQIFRALEDGPCTACELAHDIGIDSRRASVHLRNHWAAGRLVRRAHAKQDGGPGRKTVWMYALRRYLRQGERWAMASNYHDRGKTSCAE